MSLTSTFVLDFHSGFFFESSGSSAAPSPLKAGSIVTIDELNQILRVWVLLGGAVLAAFFLICTFFRFYAPEAFMTSISMADILYQKDHTFKLNQPLIIRLSAIGGFVSVITIVVAMTLTAYLLHSGVVDDLFIQQSIIIGTSDAFAVTSPAAKFDIHFVGVDTLAKCLSSCQAGSLTHSTGALIYFMIISFISSLFGESSVSASSVIVSLFEFDLFQSLFTHSFSSW